MVESFLIVITTKLNNTLNFYVYEIALKTLKVSICVSTIVHRCIFCIRLVRLMNYKHITQL